MEWATSELATRAHTIVRNPQFDFVFSERNRSETVSDSDRRYRSLTYANASWRRMLVSQPPIAQVYSCMRTPMFCITQNPEHTFSVPVWCLPWHGPAPDGIAKLQNPFGLRMADLITNHRFVPNLGRLKRCKSTLNMSNSEAWFFTRRIELTARQLQLILTQGDGEAGKGFPEQCRVASAFDSVALRRMRMDFWYRNSSCACGEPHKGAAN